MSSVEHPSSTAVEVVGCPDVGSAIMSGEEKFHGSPMGKAVGEIEGGIGTGERVASDGSEIDDDSP